MQTDELKISYPRGLEHAVHMTKSELEQHIRLMAALKMFELGKVSSGKAAELAGMSRAESAKRLIPQRLTVFRFCFSGFTLHFSPIHRL